MRRCVARRKRFTTLDAAHRTWHRTDWQRRRLFGFARNLPPPSSDYRLAQHLRMTVATMREAMTVREYVWWVQMLIHDKETAERLERERGR